MTRELRSARGMGALYVVAGAMHFVRPGFYHAIMPPEYPAPGLLIALSGLAEMVLGLALWSTRPALRRWAGLGVVVLLIAVYPANVYAALTLDAPLGLLWWRLPVQGALVAWALVASGALPQGEGSNWPGQASRARSSG